MSGFTSRIGAVYHAFSEYRARRHAIYALDSMDDDMLKDIGLSPADIMVLRGEAGFLSG